MNAFFSWQHAVRASKLESTTKLVCYTIWSHMASDGTGCFPSYALIAEESGLSRRSVIEHVQKAAEAGFLSIEHRDRENGSRSSNLYQPCMPGVVNVVHQGGEPAAPGVVNVVHPPNKPILTDQVSNPPVSPLQPERKASRRVNQPGQRLEQYLAANNLGDGCPPDFWPYAAQLGFTGDAIEHIWRNFARYWNSADARGGGRKRDWPATWQNWIDREARDGRRGGGAGRAAGGGLAAALAASVASRYGAGGGAGGVCGRPDGSGAPADPGIRYDSDGERIIPF